MKRRGLENRTRDWIRRHGLICEGDTVLLALSGGADSVCLARMLQVLRTGGGGTPPLSINIAAAHYNHRLRGDDSERDADFVRQFCRDFDIPLTVGAGDVAEAARQSGRGLEDMAREMRYAFLEETAQSLGAHTIATGHNADDNAETVLLHLIRGAGLRGLSGIPPRRGAVVRPILPLERREIEAYLSELGQDFVEDATNSDTTLRRNALRHQVMPLLRAQNPSLAAGLLRQSERLRQDSRFLDALAEEALLQCADEYKGATRGVTPCQLSASALAALEPALALRVAALAVRAAGGAADEVHARQILELAASPNPSAQTAARGGVTARRVYDKLVFESGGAAVTFAPVILPARGTITVPEIGLRIAVADGRTELSVPAKEAGFLEGAERICRFYFKTSAICGTIIVRPRQEGDAIRLAGRGGTKTIKKLMIDEKVPAGERAARPVFADEAGVIAICGIGIDERVSPGAEDEVLTVVVEGH